MQPVDEGLDYASQGMMDEDITCTISSERAPDLHADFRRDFGYDPFDDDDLD
ncbi:unnamed protein product [Schistosoma mattheei]|uniref:Transcriptional regulator n=5 Tax=Schistosoma TaxID=6181 RepID=G4LYL4_SCHMA|nr:hypothetical protein Smp_139500 [Schistosoma mansoni]VDO94281.1 unnamed protein product [Schistosoma curassoni]VDP37226.1 unnamed protein product [Schistosoma margrebowiei]VDP67777.1 unnamed protein product [Schistosoma mattheei]|eukprot:XP_018646348.1 hypothetical protein Smp_139500 [Schistosoma mansoni]